MEALKRGAFEAQSNLQHEGRFANASPVRRAARCALTLITGVVEFRTHLIKCQSLR